LIDWQEMRLVLFVLSAVFANAQVARQGYGNVTILGDFTITGSLRTTNIRSTSLVVDGSVSVTHDISCDSLTTGEAFVTILETTNLASPTGVIRVNGSLSSDSIGSSSFVRASSFIQDDVRQWAMTYHEDFEGEVKGWSSNAVNSCDGVDHHLGGHCNNVNGELKKTFSNLGEHKFVRVQASYHFLDSWEGESAYAKIDDRVVWTDTNDIRGMFDAKSFCGGDHPDTKFSVPIDVTIRHSGDFVNVAFGSTLDEHPCNESFGVDDVMISVR